MNVLLNFDVEDLNTILAKVKSSPFTSIEEYLLDLVRNSGDKSNILLVSSERKFEFTDIQIQRILTVGLSRLPTERLSGREFTAKSLYSELYGYFSGDSDDEVDSDDILDFVPRWSVLSEDSKTSFIEALHDFAGLQSTNFKSLSYSTNGEPYYIYTP